MIEPSLRSMCDDDLLLFAVLLLGGGDQRRLDGQEDDLLVDVLVTMDRVDDSQQFIGVHGPIYSRTRGAFRFELSNCPNCRLLVP